MVEGCSEPEPILAITNGETCDDFVDMVWDGNQGREGANNTDNDSPGPQNMGPGELTWLREQFRSLRQWDENENGVDGDQFGKQGDCVV